jgi:hypothetical protein
MTPDEGEELLRNMATAQKWSALYWYLIAPVGLAVGAYLLWNIPGVIFAVGLYGLARGIAQDIRAAVYPIGRAAMAMGDVHDKSIR